MIPLKDSNQCYIKCLINRTFLLHINCVSSQINMKNDSYDVENAITKKKTSQTEVYMYVYISSNKTPLLLYEYVYDFV